MNNLNVNKKIIFLTFLTYFTISTIIILFTIALVATVNIQNTKNFGNMQLAIPSKVLDIKGRLISNFISDENRELLSMKEMPDNLLHTILIREDLSFFYHRGFSIIGILRAAFNIILGRYFSGGSTLTQQLAKLLYTNQAKKSLIRKIYEIWWAVQLEKKLSKYEILEQYLNKVYFGNGNYGVVAASKFFFNKHVSKINTAEAVLLVIQLPNPKLYSPLYNPKFAKKIQKTMLEQVVGNGIISETIANKEFEVYWQNYDWTRMADSSAFSTREDKAPYFSEYIRNRILKYLPSDANLHKDGYTIYTTLDLNTQQIADEVTKEMITKARSMYKSIRTNETAIINSEIVPLVDIVSDLFGIYSSRINGKQYRKLREKNFYEENINLIATFGVMLGNVQVDKATKEYTLKNKISPKLTIQPEGAFIAIDTASGAIRAMIGGDGNAKIDEFNRSVQAKIQPGSAFKPLYYAAAIEKRKITAASIFSDSPVAFVNSEGTIYAPDNYGGKWRGNVLTRKALALSLNIPSISVLNEVGFDDAIHYSAKLLGISKQDEINKTFPRVQPLALGVISIAPIQMARAFAIFGNNGEEVNPFGIRYIEDRNGKMINNVESEILTEIKNKGENAQILSPQTTYIITDLLKSGIDYGTLASLKYSILKDFKSDIVGKTGTTQNWEDGWVIGYTPYITAAVWIGFDKKGYSLGVGGTGYALVGPVWGKFMKEYHNTLPKKIFIRPSGVINVAIQKETGLLPEGVKEEHIINELFISGTQPTKKSNYFEEKKNLIDYMDFNIYGLDEINKMDTNELGKDNFDEPEYINDNFDNQTTNNETNNNNDYNLNINVYTEDTDITEFEDENIHLD